MKTRELSILANIVFSILFFLTTQPLAASGQKPISLGLGLTNVLPPSLGVYVRTRLSPKLGLGFEFGGSPKVNLPTGPGASVSSLARGGRPILSAMARQFFSRRRLGISEFKLWYQLHISGTRAAARGPGTT